MNQRLRISGRIRHLRFTILAASALLLLNACGSRTTHTGKESPQPPATTLEASANRRPAPALRLAGSEESSATTFRIDSVVTLRGRVVVAHEVRSFTPAGDTTEYWLVDPSGALEREYARASGGSTSGLPVEAELRLRYKGPSDEGFAAQYEGVFEVEKILCVKKAEE